MMNEFGSVFAGVAVAAVAVISAVIVSRRADERSAAEAERQRQAAVEAAMRNLALTCWRCRSLAPPIPGTGNRYKCGSCANQFAAARHGL